MNSRIVTAAAVLRKVEAAVLSAAILGIAGLAIANVVARTVFGSSLAIAEELSQFLIIAVTFVGLSYAASLRRHIRMTALSEQLPPRAKARWARVIHTATAVLMVLLCGYACRYVYAVYELGGVYPVTRLPFFVVYLVAPIGFALAGVQYAAMAWGADAQESDMITDRGEDLNPPPRAEG